MDRRGVSDFLFRCDRGPSASLKRLVTRRVLFTLGCEVCYKETIESVKHPIAGQPTRFPAAAWAGQERVFVEAFAILEQAIAEQAFPSASVAVTFSGKLVALKALGRFTYDENSSALDCDAIFDLASLSKVVATSSMAMILCERGLLDLAMPLVEILPEFAGQDGRRRAVTLRHLLAHSSGLPSYERLFLRSKTREDMVRQACLVPLLEPPGTRTVYSDIGFLLLGIALERIADESLAGFCQREVFGPLGMSEVGFNPPLQLKRRIPPTCDDRTFRHRIIQGEVQDENASVMGGVAGHAGLFATAGDLARFAHTLLLGGSPLVGPETLSRFTRRESSPQGTSRALGWDTPSSPSQSGRHLSKSTFGHLGYTGTSLWIDPELELSITLLTNRTWPDCSTQMIKQVRPRFHDAVVEALRGPS